MSLLTVAEIAEKVGVTGQTIYKMANDGLFPTAASEDHWLWDRKHFSTIVETVRQQPSRGRKRKQTKSKGDLK